MGLLLQTLENWKLGVRHVFSLVIYDFHLTYVQILANDG